MISVWDLHCWWYKSQRSPSLLFGFQAGFAGLPSENKQISLYLANEQICHGNHRETINTKSCHDIFMESFFQVEEFL